MDNDKKFFKIPAIPLEELHIDNKKHDFEFTRSYHMFKKNKKYIEYPICSRCGKLHRSEGGFKLNYFLHESCGIVEVKLCKKCSMIYEDILNDIMERLEKIHHDISFETYIRNTEITQEKICKKLNKK